MPNPHLLAWASVPPQNAAPNRRRIEGEGASLVRIEVKAGHKAARHSHDHEQFVQVLSGSGTLETEEGVRRFGPGAVFHFPADAWHAAEFDTDTVLVETNVK
jgi:quercetin dioxygenase-like cupin family protein